MNPYRSAPPPFVSARVRTTLRWVYLALVIGTFVLGCSAAQKAIEWAVVKDVTGAVCPLVVQSVNPTLAPICVGVTELETVLQQLTSAAKPASDAGTAGAELAPDALYQAILAHRAAAVR